MFAHEYAFDIKLAAVVRVRASDEISARAAIEAVLDCVSLDVRLCSDEGELVITEASVWTDVTDDRPHLFEVDGENVEH